MKKNKIIGVIIMIASSISLLLAGIIEKSYVITEDCNQLIGSLIVLILTALIALWIVGIGYGVWIFLKDEDESK